MQTASKNLSSDTPVRWAILGYGAHAAQVMHPAFGDCRDSSLVSIATNTPGKHEKLAAEFPELTLHHSYEALLADSSVEAVYVGLPNHLHHAWCLELLRAKKHVLCDKPLTLRACDAVEIARVAQQTQRFALEGFMYRFHPQLNKLAEMLHSGSVGNPRLIEAHFHYHLLDQSNIRLKKEAEGGALNDVGCYLLDVSRLLAQAQPVSVSASWTISPETGVDEVCVMQLEFASGLNAHLTAGTRLVRENSLSIYGTEGKLLLPDAFRIPRNKAGMIQLNALDGKTQRLTVEPANAYAIEIDEFSALIRGKTPGNSLFENGVENARLLELCRNSCTSGQRLKVETLF